MELRPEYARIAAAELSKARREIGSASPRMFAQVYLAPIFNRPFSRMHTELLDELAVLHTRRGSHVAVAAPRGHAKSTVVTLAYVLWCLVCKKEPFVVVVSGTADQAKKLLEHVKRQIESNPLLREDFPELAAAARIAPWRRDSILLPNNHILVSYAAGQNLRGVRHGKDRPTLIIGDDLEDKLQVVSEEQRIKLADWFNSTLMKAGTPETNVIVVGTVFHHDSLLANLLDPAKSPGWKTMRFRAVESFSGRPDLWERWGAIMRSQAQYESATGAEAAARFLERHASDMLAGTQVLWPDHYSYRELMLTRLREGESTFQAEFQNEPLDPDQCLFSKADIVYWDDTYESPEALLAAMGQTRHERAGCFYGACDPSLGGNPTKGDFSAIVILFKPRRSEVKYVVAADIARRTPDETIERILHYARMYRFSNFGIETNQFQEVMADNLRRRASELGVAMPIHKIKNRSGKQQRIAGLESEVSQGLLVFARRHVALMEQLRSFPLGKHDDGPDALEMAVATSANTNHWQIADFDGTVRWDSRYGGPLPYGN
jgi:predicted phage terminase large subunit-like protein